MINVKQLKSLSARLEFIGDGIANHHMDTKIGCTHVELTHIGVTIHYDAGYFDSGNDVNLTFAQVLNGTKQKVVKDYIEADNKLWAAYHKRQEEDSKRFEEEHQDRQEAKDLEDFKRLTKKYGESK